MNGLRNYLYYLSNISNILILLASPIDCGAQEIKCNIKNYLIDTYGCQKSRGESTRAPGNRATCLLTDFNETLPV